MQIFINGTLTDIKNVGWNDHLNYGQMQRWQPNQSFFYAILFSKSDFLARFSDQFATEAAEYKKIDAEDGGAPSSFAEFDYGTLEKALARPFALADALDYVMIDHIYPAILGEPIGTYTINCLDRVVVSLDRVTLEGRGYRRGVEGIMPYEDWMDGKAP